MESKNVHIAIWSTILAFSLVLGAVTFILFFNLNKQIDDLRADSKEIELKVAKITELNYEITNDEPVTFILKNYNGVIGVFDQSGILTDIIDVDIKSLPEQDRTLLEAGIWARSRQELASLIEDYTG